MNLQEFAKIVAQDVWGFVPNREIKPVHLANGFFRSVSSIQTRPELLHAAGAGFIKGQSRTTTRQLQGDLRQHGALADSDDVRELERLSHLRSALNLVFDQDRAFFPGPTYSPTLSSAAQSSADRSDNRTGRFFAQLLNHRNEALVERLDAILQATTDNVSVLSFPLMPRDRQVTFAGVVPDAEIVSLLESRSILANVAVGMERILAVSDQFDKLTFLQRFIVFTSFGLFLSLPNAVDPQLDDGVQRWAPILLCADARDPLLREASRGAFIRTRHLTQNAYELGAARQLHDRGQASLSQDEYLDQIRSGDFKSTRNQNGEDFVRDFEAECAAVDDTGLAFRRALVQAAFREFGSSDPIRFLTSIGRLGGLLFPRAQGRGEKYFVPTPELLDAIIMATLEPSEHVTSSEFWERTYRSFGVMCGARGLEDARTLSAVGIQSASMESLRSNALAVERELARMGHARVFADGVTIIGAGR